MCDFLNLERALLLIPSLYDESLAAAAWGFKPHPSLWKLPLTPTLETRLSSGLPQILTEETAELLNALGVQSGLAPGKAAGFPLLRGGELRGLLVLLDAPAFDLEDKELFPHWDQLRIFLSKAISGGDSGEAESLSPPVQGARMIARMEKILQVGAKILLVEFPLREACLRLETAGFPRLPDPYALEVLEHIQALAGPWGGAFFYRRQSVYGVLALPTKLDAEILVHQLEMTLHFVPEISPPELQSRILHGAAEIAALDPKDFPWKW